MVYAWKLDAGKGVDLDAVDPRHNAGLTKEEGLALIPDLQAELSALQELCYAAEHQAVLIVLQGMDTSGKDGTIKHVMDSVNPQGCRVVTFKAPTPVERSHDFLWRVHAGVPPRGLFGIFNRSHYEDVLIVRVHGLVPEPVWRARYEHINAFEKLLADDGTIVLKFFLHISKEEQAARLLERETDKDKRWKLNAADYLERERWPAYMEAYQDALSACATPYAPWYVVPADRKWFRNLAVAQAVVEALRPHRDDWQAALRARGEENHEALLALRAQGKGKL
jgi:PPK2 family polyphosphate:nucleotide phosphotransferase